MKKTPGDNFILHSGFWDMMHEGQMDRQKDDQKK